MVCSVDTSQTLSSVTPITKKAHGKSVYGGRDGLQPQTSPRLSWLQALLSAQPASCRDPGPYGTVPWSEQPGALTDTYSGYGCVFLSCNTSAQTIILRLIECRICHHNILHSIASDRGTHFTEKEVWQWAQAR